MIDVVFQNLTSDKSFREDFFNKILTAGVGELGFYNKDIEVSLSLVGPEKIRELNREYRKKDKVTDVLSFPIEAKPLKESGIWPLGDIFICLSFAKNEAKSENISIEQKLAQLTAHGFLHLVGYDHENSIAEADKMEKLEKVILNKIAP